MVTHSLSLLGSQIGGRHLLDIIGLGLAGGVIGVAAWNENAALMPLAALFPLCFGLAPTRLSAVALSMGYFLAASRGLSEGAATFFRADLLVGLLLWFAASLVFVSIHGAFWSIQPTRRVIGYAVAATLLAIPPFGILGWVSPVTLAGIILPGFGWIGLTITWALLVALAFGRRRPALLAVIGVLWFCGSALGKDPIAADGWSGSQTNVVYNTGSRDFQRSFAFVTEANRLTPRSDAQIVVFAEGAVGWRTDTAEWAWIDLAKRTGKTLYAGVEDANGKGYDNALARITGTGFEVVYRQRMPVPVSMWRPWSEQSAVAHLDQPPMVMLDGRPTAVLICYEQLLVWPVLQSRYAGADHILGVSNLWWAEGTSIPGIQMAVMTAWARLFNMTLTVSFNR